MSDIASSLPNVLAVVVKNQAAPVSVTALSESFSKSLPEEKKRPRTIQTSSMYAAVPELEAEEKAEEKKKKRGKWINPYDFLMAMISCAVGFGNVWRFPYLAFHHGGGSFLIAYVFFFVCVAVPMLLMEASLGQYFGVGALEIWKILPIFKGVGIANLVICFTILAYYHVIISWCIFYVFSCFSRVFPWEQCNHYWNDLSECNAKNDTHSGKTIGTAASQFFRTRVLGKSETLLELGDMRWELIGIAVGVWFIIFICLRRSLVKARAFIWISALFPYFILSGLFLRSLLLPGASAGIKALVTPKMDKLLTLEIWKDAGEQVFFSYGLANAGIISLSAYNDFNNNVVRDTLITCFVNGGTSIVAGFTVFSTLGFLADRLHISLEELNELEHFTGPGLTFKVYPEALVKIPPKHIWTTFFFIMITLLGLSSLVCLVESFYSACEDRFPKLMRRHRKKSLVALCVFIISISMIMFTQAGTHWLHLVEGYGASGYSLLFVAFFELIGVGWGFGAEKLWHAINEMRGKQPSRIWVIMWKYVSPLVVGATFVVMMVQTIVYREVHKDRPMWVNLFGVLLSLVSMLSIFVYAIYYILARDAGVSVKERFIEGFTTPDDVNKERVDKFSRLIDR